MKNNGTRLIICSHLPWAHEETESGHVNPNLYTNKFELISDKLSPLAKNKRISIDILKVLDDNFQDIVNAIQNGTTRGISDESFRPKEKIGTESFRIAPGKTSMHIMKGSDWVHRVKKDQSIYCNEIAGIDGIILVLKVIIEFYKIENR